MIEIYWMHVWNSLVILVVVVYLCVGGQACVCIKSRRRFVVSCFNTVCLIPLRWGLSLNLELGQQLVSSSNPPISALYTAGVISMPWPHPVLFMDATDANSCPHACTASTLTHQAISPVLTSPFFTYLHCDCLVLLTSNMDFSLTSNEVKTPMIKFNVNWLEIKGL